MSYGKCILSTWYPLDFAEVEVRCITLINLEITTLTSQTWCDA